MSFPVDVLYTWTGESGKNEMRFADHGELKHSLRSVTKFMPWVRRIFIVMNEKKKPSWFADDYETRVTIVDHDDIFTDEIGVVRPVTNSNSIETAISNTPGLSEHFIYFNDDFFIAKPLEPAYFFNEDGKAITRAKYEMVDMTETTFKGSLPPLTKGFHAHTPLPLRVSAYKRFKLAYPDYIRWIRQQNKRTGVGCDRCSLVRLPCPCMQSIHGTFAQWMVANNFAVHGNHQVRDILNVNYFNHTNYKNLQAVRTIEDIKSETFTINDSAETGRDEFGKGVSAFLSRVFPDPAPFESPSLVHREHATGDTLDTRTWSLITTVIMLLIVFTFLLQIKFECPSVPRN